MQGAAISPDGQQIVYLDAIPGEQSYYLSLVSSAGSDARPLFPAGLSAYMLDDAWSPDGAHVLFAGNCTETEGGLCMVNMQTMERQLVRVPDGVGDAPRWSPDGKVIAYAGIIEGETRCDHVRKDREPVACDYEALGVYLIEVDTGTTTFLARGRLPVWSPDGSMLAFLSYESGMPEIWSIQRDGGNLRQVTADGLFKDLFSGLTWRN